MGFNVSAATDLIKDLRQFETNEQQAIEVVVGEYRSSGRLSEGDALKRDGAAHLHYMAGLRSQYEADVVGVSSLDAYGLMSRLVAALQADQFTFEKTYPDVLRTRFLMTP
jgi:hypothetical protein